MQKKSMHYDVVVIGSGFGGTMVALTLARALKGTGKKILMLERGTWWTTPVSTVADKEVKTYSFLQGKQQPVQFWPSMDHFKGFADIVIRCLRRKGNEDGLYDFTSFGKKSLLGALSENDGVSVLRASGVGGGSLVYSNITIQPPDSVFEDPRWPGWTRDKAKRDSYYELARKAIGFGVAYAREAQTNPAEASKFQVYGDLHNIVTRSARLDPHFEEVIDPGIGRPLRRIATADSNSHPDTDPKNALWIDRARVFQTAGKQLADTDPSVVYGTVDSSINDLPLGPATYDPGKNPGNYCERQGRCNVGCLPGARYTLNKQLMQAMHGKPDGTPAQFPNLELWPLVEVDHVKAGNTGYTILYRKRDAKEPEDYEAGAITAMRVILAAGCLGTNEILLRSKQSKGLPGLSDRLGEGFSTNGDYLAFLDDTRERVSLTRGPVTTSFMHFNQTGPKRQQFHTIEDQGIPKALASIVGYGIPFLQAVAHGPQSHWRSFFELLRLLRDRAVAEVASYFRNAEQRQVEFLSEDEKTARMMCVLGIGLDAADGQLTLGKHGETALRLHRPDGKKFHDDPIYGEIRQSLAKLAKVLSDKPDATFRNPFLTSTADALEAKAVLIAHPLGGCKMAKNAAEGSVDEFGRVFDVSKPGAATYPGLYVADASLIPTALGVNPSLTISALSLCVADKVLEEIQQEMSSATQPATGRKKAAPAGAMVR